MYDRLVYHTDIIKGVPRFSVYTDPKKLSTFIDRFWDSITLLEDREEAMFFFKDLLTPTEIRMLAKRLQIADMLAKGYKYEDIRNHVRVTAQTISQINNKLNYGEGGLIQVLKKLEKVDESSQDKLEGKRSIISQPAGVGRMAGDLANLGLVQVNRAITRHRKVSSIKNIRAK